MSRPMRTRSEPRPAAAARSSSARAPFGSSATSADARAPRAAATARSEPGLDAEQRQRERLALARERTRRGRNPLALRERALERREPFLRRQSALGERIALVRRLPCRRTCVQGLALELFRRRAAARGVCLGFRELRAQTHDQPGRGLALHRQPRRPAAQLVRDRERRLALAGRPGQVCLDRPAFDEQLVELGLRRRSQCVLGSKEPCQHLARALGARLALDGRDPRGFCGLERRPLELCRLDAGIACVGGRIGELGANLVEERR